MTQRDFNLKEKILEYKKRSPVVFTQVLLGLGFCFNSNLKYNYIHVFRKKEYYRLLSSFVVFGDGFSQSLRNGFSVLGNAGLEISINNTKSFVKLQMLGILGILAMEVLLSQEYKREFKVLGILLDLTMKWVYYFRHSSTKVRILDQKLDTIFLVAMYTFSGSFTDGIKSFVNGVFVSYMMDVRDSKSNENVLQVVYKRLSYLYSEIKNFISIQD